LNREREELVIIISLVWFEVIQSLKPTNNKKRILLGFFLWEHKKKLNHDKNFKSFHFA
jgi:hypothetical protein